MNTSPADEPLRHGYTYTDLARYARTALALDRWHTSDTTDRYAAALNAIVETLLTADTRPSPRDLVDIGVRATNRYVADEMHHRGYDRRNLNAGPGGLPAYQRYWQHTGHAPWDERLIERIALTQMWPQLTLAQQQAVMALALTGDHAEAALSLGLPRTAFAARLRNARLAIANLWHEHETPPARRRRDKRVLTRSGTWAGRRLLTEDDLDQLRQRRADGATYRQLADETGYSAGALCNLLTGKRRPVSATGAIA